MILFSGITLAKQKEAALKIQVDDLRSKGIVPKVAAVLFAEDPGSVLYTEKKKEAAERVGIAYQIHSFSMTDPIEQVIEKIKVLNSDPIITGIIIQKPWRSRWETVVTSKSSSFNDWWLSLTSSIDEKKDVDGLHPNTLAAIKRNTWKEEQRVLPATCRAVLTILDQAFFQTNIPRQLSNIAIVGRSDLLGTPLYYQLLHLRFEQVTLMGRKELKQYNEIGVGLTDFDVVVTSTGQKNLITGNMIKRGSIVIDVGEPQPDVEYVSVSDVAGFLTPVPGGVGPMTIVSLLENAIDLVQNTQSTQ